MSVGAVAPDPGIVGRVGVLAVCASAVDRARAGSGGLLLVTGEPGIGKTTVLQAATSAARARGCAVVWAACPEDDAVPGFWPVVRLLTEIGAESTDAAADELRGGDAGAAEQDRFLLFDRVAGAVRRAAAERPLVLVVDDLHWADPSSLRLLGFLVKQVRNAPVLVLGSYRDTDVGPGHPLLELLAEPGTSGETLVLSGLATDDVATLVARAGRTGAGAVAGRIREHTGGNPFFVLHVARLLDAEGHLRGPESALPLPVGVRAVLERRLARLSQRCHELLEVAAVIGARFDIPLLAEVADVDTATVFDLLAEATGARLVQPVGDGTGHEFAHALVRAAASAQLPAARATVLHGRVADALRHRSGDPEVRLAAIAHHELNAGGDRAATRGVDAAERAGRHAAAARAFEQAADHFQRAIAACTDAERLAGLRLALGDARLRSGDWNAAEAAFWEAAELARDLDRADLFASAVLGIGADVGGFEVHLGDHRQLARLEEAESLLGDTSPALRSRLLARHSVAATNIASVAERREWSEEAIALARGAGDDRTLAYALSAWCDVESGPSSVEERSSVAAEMLAAAEASGDRVAALMARRFRVVALLERGDPEVHAEIDRFVRVAEALGQPLYRWYAPLFRGMQALLRGDLDEADRLCARAAALGTEAGSANAGMLSGTLHLAIAFERGQFDDVLRVLEEELGSHDWIQDLPIAIALGPLIQMAGGRTDQARATLQRLAAERFAFVPVDSEWLSTLSGVSMSILLLEDRVSAAAMYEVLRPHGGRMIVDGIAAACLDPVDYLLGRFALLADRTEEAATHLRAAVAQTQRLSAPLLEAHAKHALADAVETIDPPGAQQLRRGAAAALRSAGAAPVQVTRAGRSAPSDTVPAVVRTGTFRQEGGWWTLSFEGRTVRLADAKGLHDLRYLLARPGTPVPANALQQADGRPAAPPSHGADVLDDQARSAYRRRLDDLDAEIDDAEAMADPERASRAREEKAFLMAELSAAVGLGGRSRRMGDDADRARKAVTMRLRNAVARIGREHALLGRHLELAVRTGTVCTYEPEHPVVWSV